jgi:hypothetical protein
MNLTATLPLLLPRAVAWAEAQAQSCLAFGVPLGDPGVALARSVGVRNPGSIRLGVVQTLPMPDDPELREAAIQTGLLSPGMVGLTLGYAVFLCRGHDADPRLLSHEFRHVHHYEAAGSIGLFLPIYLSQIVQFGYLNAPYEQDARAHQRDSA